MNDINFVEFIPSNCENTKKCVSLLESQLTNKRINAFGELLKSDMVIAISDEVEAYSFAAVSFLNAGKNNKILSVNNLITNTKYENMGYTKCVIDYLIRHSKPFDKIMIRIDSGNYAYNKILLDAGFEITPNRSKNIYTLNTNKLELTHDLCSYSLKF